VKALKDILGEVVGRYRWHAAEALWEIQGVWVKAISPELAQVVRPVGFLDGTLTLAVPSPVWSQELMFWRDDLMARINAELQTPRVTRIKLVVRAMPRPGTPIDASRLARLADRSGGERE
jgi:predicted nucleic acid-binding Zn ribbon protein